MGRLLKNGLLGAMMLVLLPWVWAERAARHWRGHDVWFGAQAQWLSLLPGKWGVCWRTAFYHLSLAACPLDVGIEFGALITHSETRLGHRVYIGARTQVGWAHIGDDTMLADHVQLLSGAHHHGGREAGTQPRQQQPARYQCLEIGANCWIGGNAVVMAAVGDHSVVGAGSVVTRPVPAGVTAVGNPARVLAESPAPA